MTYSIAGRCPRRNAFGVAITSSSICVASRCAWTSPLGVVLTQNVTDPSLGPTGLSLLRQGVGAAAVCDLLKSGTPEPAWRQIGVLDRYGQVAWHSGEQALPRVAIAEDEGCLAMGNLLVDPGVPAAMIAAFKADEALDLAERLLRGLEAGLAAGGETDDEHAAGLHVSHIYDWPVVDLRIDWHEEPIRALRDLWTLYAPQQSAFQSRARRPSQAPGF